MGCIENCFEMRCNERDPSGGLKGAGAPPRCRPPYSWLWKKGSKYKKFLRFGWKSLSKKLTGRRSSLHEHFVLVKTRMGLERFEVEKSRFWSCFKSPKNRASSSLWVGGHRSTGILCASKLLWKNNAHKVEPNAGPIKNLGKSLQILKSLKTNLKFPFLIAKSSPTVTILQCCRATIRCY